MQANDNLLEFFKNTSFKFSNVIFYDEIILEPL